MAALTVTMTLVLAACATTYEPPVAPSVGAVGEGAEEGLTSVAVGVLPIVDVAPVYLGVQEGIFEKHGIDLTIDKAANGGEIISNVLSRRWQFGFSNVTSLVLEGTATDNVRLVAAGNFSSGDPAQDFGAMVVPADSPIQSVGDLAGATVAVNADQGINQSMVMQFVESVGGDPGSVSFAAMGFGAMPEAVTAGQSEDGVAIDAAFIVEPHLSRAKAAGAREIPNSSYGAISPDLMIAAYFTSNDLMVTDPEVVENFSAAMKESLALAQSDPEAARSVLDEYTEIDTAVKESMVLPRWLPDPSRESAVLLGQLATKFFNKSAEPDSIFPSN